MPGAKKPTVAKTPSGGGKTRSATVVTGIAKRKRGRGKRTYVSTPKSR